MSKDIHAAQEMMQKTGMAAVPTIIVDGQAVVGFDRRRLEALLT